VVECEIANNFDEIENYCEDVGFVDVGIGAGAASELDLSRYADYGGEVGIVGEGMRAIGNAKIKKCLLLQ